LLQGLGIGMVESGRVWVLAFGLGLRGVSTGMVFGHYQASWPSGEYWFTEAAGTQGGGGGDSNPRNSSVRHLANVACN
jgi:hypothetical protein